MSTSFRQPTHRDIGKMVEVSWNEDFSDSITDTLEAIHHYRGGATYTFANHIAREFCRIPIDTTNAADQLAIAADYLADAGMELGAEVLRQEAEKQSQATKPQRRPYFDPLANVDKSAAKRANIGSHFYPGCEGDGESFYTSDCEHGCGCWMGSSRSGGHEGVDQFGQCPNNLAAKAVEQ